MKHTNKSLRGVTLVEIAIVLVIIGLLLGGILKGQELINNAKVRAIADRQNSLKVAWFAFLDRYQAAPGDYVAAAQNVPGAGSPTPAGNAGDGKGPGDGVIIDTESPFVMQNLTGAGYLRCPQCTYGDAALVAPKADNSLQNQYGGVMAIFLDGQTLGSGAVTDSYATTDAARTARLMIHTGQNIPSNIIAEVDRKIDDGVPQQGDVRASNYKAVGIAPKGACIDNDTTDAAQTNGADTYVGIGVEAGWRYADVVPVANCGAAVVI